MFLGLVEVSKLAKYLAMIKSIFFPSLKILPLSQILLQNFDDAFVKPCNENTLCFDHPHLTKTFLISISTSTFLVPKVD